MSRNEAGDAQVVYRQILVDGSYEGFGRHATPSDLATEPAAVDDLEKNISERDFDGLQRT